MEWISYISKTRQEFQVQWNLISSELMKSMTFPEIRKPYTRCAKGTPVSLSHARLEETLSMAQYQVAVPRWLASLSRSQLSSSPHFLAKLLGASHSENLRIKSLSFDLRKVVCKSFTLSLWAFDSWFT